MKFRKLAVPAMALAMSSPLFAYTALSHAADNAAKPATSTPAKPSAQQAQDQALMKFSEAGNAAMRDIRGARFAIFNGDTKIAATLLQAAKTSIGQAEKEAPVYATTSTMLVGGKVVATTSDRHEIKRVPVDGQFTLADNFVLTPEKKTHIEKANEHFKKGEQSKAYEALRLGEVDVNFTRAWMPIEQSQKHLEQAIKLAASGKYYEANLALKAIEDGVTMDTVSISELPKRPAG